MAHAVPTVAPPPPKSLIQPLRNFVAVFDQIPGTLRLVWQADRSSVVVLALLTVIAAVLPAGIAYVGKLIIDAVVHAAQTGAADARARVVSLVLFELALMVLSTLIGRSMGLVREL